MNPLPSNLPSPPSTLATKDRKVFSGFFGRFVEWIRDLFRSDDEKIEAVVRRTLVYPKERDWALQRIIQSVHCKDPHAESLARFFALPTPPSSPKIAQQLAMLRVRVLLTDPSSESETLSNLISALTDAPKTSPEEWKAFLSTLPHITWPLLSSFAEALRTGNPKALYEAVGEYLFKNPSDTRLLPLALAAAGLFPGTTAQQSIVESLCGTIEAVGISCVPPDGLLLPGKLKGCLSTAINLQSLATALHAEDRVNAALRAVMSNVQRVPGFTATVEAIATYCRPPGEELIFENLKECLRTIATCPKEVQIPLCIAIRNKLTSARGLLPKEIEPADLENQILCLPELSQTIFTSSWIQTRADFDRFLTSQKPSP